METLFIDEIKHNVRELVAFNHNAAWWADSFWEKIREKKIQIPYENNNIMQNAVILNDTSSANHHGCRLVMQNMHSALKEHEINVLATSFVGEEWSQNKIFLQAMKRSQIIVINGEGTLHDGRDEAETLLRMALHPLAKGKKLIIANALYENNPDIWIETYLKKFSAIGLRDKDSWEVCAGKLSDTKVWLTTDLSLYGAVETHYSDGSRAGVAIGDSVLKETNKALCRYYRENRSHSLCYMPIRTAQKNTRSIFNLSSLRYQVKLRIKRLFDRNLMYYPEEQAFLSALATKELYITGRFHGVCMALRTRTPFFALSSNSGKIESLLRAVGLEHRLVAEVNVSLLGNIQPFNTEEKKKIDAFLENAQESWDYFWQHSL